jgi:adenylosuccinate lyase
MHKRYESPEIAAVWSDQSRNLRERMLWIAVMEAQKAAGLEIHQDHIDAYRDLALSQAAMAPGEHELKLEMADIAELEAETRHDLYARLRWLNESVGCDDAHQGLTSSDITENVQQGQIVASAEVIQQHAEQVMRRLFMFVREHAALPIVARTHGRPAQLTTIGKRAADWMQELGGAMARLDDAIDGYLPRGIKGAVGTQADMAQALLAARPDWVEAVNLADRIDMEIADDAAMIATGQSYPRGADLPIVSATLQVAAACGTIATAVRLMALSGLLVEDAREHVGSSAMPHKRNPRMAERVCGLAVVARGYAGMSQELAGFQWLEGDVSTSAARRIALPGLFHTVDCMLANVAQILDRMELDFEAIRAERDLWMPELASGALLAALVRRGVPRTKAHEVLRHHYQQLGRPDCESQRLLTLAYHLENEDEQFRLTQQQVEEAFDLERLVGLAPRLALTMASDEMGEALEPLDFSWPKEQP